MSLQLIKDGYGNDTGVFVPITDWNIITEKHQDLKELVSVQPRTFAKVKLSQLAGTLSKETADAMLKYVEESRNEWEERLEKKLC